MTKRAILFILLLSLQLPVLSQKYLGFSGGMMLHTGFLKSSSFPIFTPEGVSLGMHQVKGSPFGIGGAIKFHFGNTKDQLRLGMEGYHSTLNYGKFESSYSVRQGGVLIDYIRQGKRVSPFIGSHFGMGSGSSLILLKETPYDFITEENVSFRKYPIYSVSPYVGAEIKFTKKISFLVKADYLFLLSKASEDFPSGPRIFCGILFTRY